MAGPSLGHILFAASLACGCAPKPCPAPAGALPDVVWLRTPTQTFTRDWSAALWDGQVCVKPNESLGERDADGWTLLGRTGVPGGAAVTRWGTPGRITELSADGVWLLALTDDGYWYRASDMRHDVRRSIRWTDRWGWPLGLGSGLSSDFSSPGGWAVSDSHPSTTGETTDSAGNVHSVGLGVGHVFRMGPDGSHLYFKDWWLPADWSRQVCLPERGVMRPVAMSASGSTLFVMDAHGEMYTRQFDFDIGGENALLTYSYDWSDDALSGTTRALPAPDWQRQPSPEGGQLTDQITIFQDGAGDAARVLRVEGVFDGVVGVFEKRVDETEWSFMPTGASLTGAFIDDLVALDGAPEDVRVLAQVAREGGSETLDVEILDFNLWCSPSRVQLSMGGETLTVDGRPLTLTLHHVHDMVDVVRPRDWVDRGLSGQVRGALMIPDDISRVDQASAGDVAMRILGDHVVVNFEGTASADHVLLNEMDSSWRFGVPRAQKAEKGDRVLLRPR